MIDVAALILLTIMAVRVSMGVFREREIFHEFKQSKALAAVSLLFPLAPLALLMGARSFGILGALIGAVACFLPALVVARRNLAVFERSGTDRTAQAIGVTSQAIGTTIGGLCYVALVVMLMLAGLVGGQ